MTTGRINQVTRLSALGAAETKLSPFQHKHRHTPVITCCRGTLHRRDSQNCLPTAQSDTNRCHDWQESPNRATSLGGQRHALQRLPQQSSATAGNRPRTVQSGQRTPKATRRNAQQLAHQSFVQTLFATTN